MEFQHINVKIYVNDNLKVDPVRFIEVFHQWIQQDLLEELLIDVVDYRHVPAGPAVLLVAHEADYSLDNTGNRYGLRYNRKATLNGSNQDRFRQAFLAAANACRLLEDKFAVEDSLQFSRQEFELFVNDRALAPNTPETFATCKPELETFLEQLLGHAKFSVEHRADQRSLFGVNIRVADPFDLTTILQNR